MPLERSKIKLLSRGSQRYHFVVFSGFRQRISPFSKSDNAFNTILNFIGQHTIIVHGKFDKK